MKKLTRTPCYVPLLIGPQKIQQDFSVASPLGPTQLLEGFVHTLEAGTSFVVCGDYRSYKMSEHLTTRSKVFMGDFVQILTNFDEVDGVLEVNMVEHTEFEDKPTTMPYMPAKIQDTEIKLGQRVMVVAPKAFNRIEHIAKSCQELGDNVHKIVLLLDETETAKNYLKQYAATVGLIPTFAEIRHQIVGCLHTLLSSKYNAQKGKHVVVFIDNLSKLSRLYNKSNPQEGGSIDLSQLWPDALIDVKDFYLSARAFENSGSLTFVMYANTPDSPNDVYLFDEFGDISNVIIKGE